MVKGTVINLNLFPRGWPAVADHFNTLQFFPFLRGACICAVIIEMKITSQVAKQEHKNVRKMISKTRLNLRYME